ncbi:MAG: proline dehydrogenase family protein [Nitrospira sp.]|jgi:RHH-type proline utilization regulon transcriptional repressor/proline dehydrogenase/delta 1-pyrroline-5-carboxylate dehydrogenase|nr:proline dehydrogenase family protein [Nitrospira sp.]
MANSHSLEPAILRIGAHLAQLSAGLSPTLFERRWWSHAAINLAMKDPAFKTRLFRFIDVLPAVADDARVVSLAEEYFGQVDTELFGLQWGLKTLASTGIGARMTGKAIRHHVEQMARLFIAGATVAEAAPVFARLWTEGRTWSVDLLGEATISETEADQYRDRCLEALTTLSQAAASWAPSPRLERDHLGPLPRVQLSLKISALTSRLDAIDPEGCYRAVAARLRPIVDLAAATACGLIFDMEQADTKDLLRSIFTRLFAEPAYRSYPHAGLALQAYHRETEQDIHDLLSWVRARGTPITIRLVKGAYWDSDTVRYRQAGWPVPLFEQKAETDAHYESLAHTILQHSPLIRPAFGTHNLRTLAVIEAVAESLRLAPETVEYQMIYGMAEPFQHAMVTLGRRVRLYTPVGRLLPGMAYLVRRLLENTSNESFLRKEYVESQSLATLLAPPAVLSQPSAPASSDGFRNEPHSDFSRLPLRTAMQDAITSVRARKGNILEPATNALRLNGPLMESHNPAQPDDIVATVRTASEADIESAVRLAQSHAETWHRRPADERVAVMKHAAALMRTRRYELAAWEIVEVGKPWREADADVAEAIDFLEYYASHMERLAQPLKLGDRPGELNHRVYGPRGVAAVIAPWNFPLAIPTGMVAAALVTGNTVLFKPSERAPLMGRLLTDILLEAGVPPEALMCLPGGPEIGRALVGRPEVSTIAFTGSKAVGLQILAGAAAVQPGQRHVKRVIAEMGGKNAIIVDDSADLDEAILGVVASFTGYAGQKCSACSRAIVHESVYEPFLSRLNDAVMSLTIGDPRDPGTQVGPVIDARAKQRIEECIAAGAREGRLLVRRSSEGPGFFVGPTVVAEVKPHHRLAQEEIFGPVLAVMKAADMEEALEIANGTAYALTGGIYSRSPANLALARARFDVGNLYVNRPITGALVGRQPFGGHRLSGVGAKAGGEDYLAQFMISRVISENTLRRGFEAAD